MYNEGIGFLREVAAASLDVFYPRHCPVCDEIVGIAEKRNDRIVMRPYIHGKCADKVKVIRGATCMKCGKKLPKGDEEQEYCRDCKRVRHSFTRGFSVFDYRSISGSIYRFKYMGRQEYADYYADMTARFLGKRLQKLGIDAIVPVPMYRNKEWMRGYNQAQVYAEKVSRLLGIPLFANVIKRMRNTQPMKELDARARRNNLKKAFNIARNDVKFKCVLVIDDIYTTGSTIDEIAHEFHMVGVRKVYFLTLAIGQTT